MSRKKLLKFDQLSNFSPASIGDRINYVIALMRLSSPKFSELMQISTGNLNGLINDDSKPSAGLLARMLEHLNVNVNWILTGAGEIFLGESRHDNTLSPDAQPIPAAPPTATSNSQRFRISDAMTMAARVLESGTTYAIALYLNIEHFDRAIRAEAKVAVLEEQMEAMQKRMDTMEAALAKCVPRDAPEDDSGGDEAEEGRPVSGNERVA